jgi:putative ABC transport system substrate-binding protein
MNNRRKLIVALGAGVLVVPFASVAQAQGKVWRVGFLTLRQVAILESDVYYGPFRQGMRELGYVEGKNLLIEWRSADGKSDRLPALASELVRLKVDVIVAAATAATSAAQKATSTVPIVMGIVADPVGSGLVKSLAHPGGNITGLSSIAGDLSPKLLELLRNMVPKLSRVAVLVNPSNPIHATTLKNVQIAAQGINVKVLSAEAQTSQEIEKAFSMMSREKAGALIVMRDEFLNQQARQISELAAKNRLPSIAGLREYVEAGGLLSYGSSISDVFRRAATYVDKIIKGAKPADIPVEQPTKFELIINGKTTKALGLKIPQSLLISADKVIE